MDDNVPEKRIFGQAPGAQIIWTLIRPLSGENAAPDGLAGASAG